MNMVFGKLGRRLIQRVHDFKIRSKLLASFLLLILVPIALIGTLTYQKSRSLIQEKTNDYTLDLLSEVSKNIELHLVDIDRLYHTVFTNVDVRNALREANKGFDSQVEYVAAAKRINHFLDSVIIDRDEVQSIQLYSLKPYLFQSSDPPLTELSREEWRSLQKNEGNLIWMDPEPLVPAVTAGSSVYDMDNLKKSGYFVLHLREKALYSIYGSIQLGKQGELYIINQGGVIISHGDKELINTRPSAAYIGQVLSGGKQGSFKTALNNQNAVVNYRMIGETGWRIVSVIPATEYENLSILLKNWMLVLFAIFITVAVILSYIVSNSISKPIRQLSAVMKNVEGARLDARFVYNSRNEIGLLSRNFNRMVDRINHLVNKVYQEELLKQQSQLKYLMFQINPHFLFNTLETINWLARIQGAPEVGKLSKALGDLMREGIKGKDFIPLVSEIGNVEKYVYIQKHRFGDKFEVDTDIDPNALSLSVPRFILQPLVENAIVHGLELAMDKGFIEIRGYFEQGRLLLTVSDNGGGMEPAKLEEIRSVLDGGPADTAGIGLLNVHQRIQLHYGKEYGLRVDSSCGEGTEITITLPGIPGMTGRNEQESSPAP
ncbi:HAMP domain-containing protein [Paenibacillus macerans]|uniref:histidine kinase n=2 Tax=Paenibacillus TaxID=44249 RepID=A0A090Z6S9_PAEMA|nr:HAMP domain protein [Paenibacillus macerans]MUG23047.1 HAMP domain-containing protein [Paenibacillus macerans]SUA85247.1 Cache sensor signal transduction histidine kinase [Paenibacillus macerans]